MTHQQHPLYNKGTGRTHHRGKATGRGPTSRVRVHPRQPRPPLNDNIVSWGHHVMGRGRPWGRLGCGRPRHHPLQGKDHRRTGLAHHHMGYSHRGKATCCRPSIVGCRASSRIHLHRGLRPSIIGCRPSDRIRLHRRQHKPPLNDDIVS
jgi:hypothetical protein